MNKSILHITSSDLGNSYNSEHTYEVNFSITSYVGTFDKNDSNLLNIVKTPYVPQKGDKIYFLPGVNIPRVKFRNIAVEYGIKTVRQFDQANVFFGSSKSIHEMTNTMWVYEIKTTEFLAFIELISDRLDNHTKDKIKTAFEFYDNEIIGVDYNIKKSVDDALSIDSNGWSNRMTYVEESDKDLYLHCQGVTIYDESSVIDILNGEEAAIIDKEVYTHLSEMLNSSDRDNHVLAMEIMANSKYTESLVYLELLFHDYSYNISNSHTKNHVNFKSLISYLDKNKNYLNADIDDIVDSLRAKDQFTPDKLEIVMEHLSQTIANQGNSKYFSVKTITIQPDYIELLGSNYTYTIQEDYIPEVNNSLPDPVEIEEEVLEDELIEAAFTNIERKELKSELIALEEEELVEKDLATYKQEESNNHQITTNDTDIDWF
jgi:hypothetical protein